MTDELIVLVQYRASYQFNGDIEAADRMISRALRAGYKRI